MMRNKRMQLKVYLISNFKKQAEAIAINNEFPMEF